MDWCTHCRKPCREECINGFIACPTCGKILGEVGVQRSCKIVKARMKRVVMKKKKKKKKAGASAGTTGPDFPCGSSGAVIHESECLVDNKDQLIQLSMEVVVALPATVEGDGQPTECAL